MTPLITGRGPSCIKHKFKNRPPPASRANFSCLHVRMPMISIAAAHTGKASSIAFWIKPESVTWICCILENKLLLISNNKNSQPQLPPPKKKKKHVPLCFPGRFMEVCDALVLLDFQASFTLYQKFCEANELGRDKNYKMEIGLPSSKLTWHWKMTMFDN